MKKEPIKVTADAKSNRTLYHKIRKENSAGRMGRQSWANEAKGTLRLSLTPTKRTAVHGLHLLRELLEAHFYLPFACGCSGDKSVMAVSLSTNTIKLYDPETGGFKGDLTGHTCTISGLDFPDPSSPQLLFSSSTDSTIRTWDVRVGKQVAVFRAPVSSEELWSFSIGGSPANLIAGGGNAQVLIWDWRSKKLAATWDDLHTEAVTQVHFHPSKKEQLLTASVDGLINVLDTKVALDSEDVHEATMSVGTSLSKFGFYGKDNEMLWILTHIETLSIWSLEDQVEAITFGDVRTKTSYCWSHPSIKYLINCHSTPGTEDLWLAAGNNDGTVGYFPVASSKSSNQSTPSTGVFGDVSAVLKGGHEGIVRAIWLSQMQGLEQALFCWTGGEDGRLCSWAQNGSMKVGRAWVSSNLAMRNRSSSKHRQTPY